MTRNIFWEKAAFLFKVNLDVRDYIFSVSSRIDRSYGDKNSKEAAVSIFCTCSIWTASFCWLVLDSFCGIKLSRVLRLIEKLN